MHKSKFIGGALFLSLSLLACGGGGGGGGAKAEDTTSTVNTTTGGNNTGDTGGTNNGSNNNGGTTTPGFVVGTATKSGNTYSLTSTGKTISATSQGTLDGTQPQFLKTVSIDGKQSYFTALKSASNTSDYVGAAAINNSAVYLGQSGTKSVPIAVNEVLTFSGPLVIVTPTERSNSTFTAEVDFGSGQFTGTSKGGELTLMGYVDGASITGTSSYKGSAGQLDAGFYQGGAEINGVFAGDKKDYAGVFATKK